MKNLRISIAQMAPSLLDVRANLERILRFMEEASSGGSDLLVLPEMALTGYGIEGALEDQGVRARLSRRTRTALSSIRTASARLGLDVVVSYPLIFRTRTFIAAEYVEKGRKNALHRKINLCNYGHYSEHLHFDAGNRPTLARTRLGHFGLLVCEDIWHAANGIVETLSGAEVLLVPAAPCVLSEEAGPANLEQWETITKATAFLQTSYLALATRVGMEGQNRFLGGSHLVSPEGGVVHRMPLYEEGISQVKIDRELLSEVRKKRPLLSNERVTIYANAFRKIARERG